MLVAQGSLAPMEEGVLAETASVSMAQATAVASPAGVSPVEMGAVLTAWAAPLVQAEKVLVAAVV